MKLCTEPKTNWERGQRCSALMKDVVVQRTQYPDRNIPDRNIEDLTNEEIGPAIHYLEPHSELNEEGRDGCSRATAIIVLTILLGVIALIWLYR